MNTKFKIFKKIYESNDLRKMSLIIPAKKIWIKDGENLRIPYLGRNFTISQNDVKDFETNIGKNVSFEFNPDENIITNPVFENN